MKVYEVHYDNGQAWEDNWQSTDAICATYEGAVKYIEERGAVAEKDWQGKPVWKYPEYVCSKNNIDCNDCEKYYDSDKYDGTKWIVDDDYETDECPELWEREINSTDYSSYTIIEHEVIE